MLLLLAGCSSWFVIDFLSILPISYLQLLFGEADAEESQTGGNTKLLKILRMVRLAKLLRLAKLQRLVKKYSYEITGLAAGAKLSGTIGAALLLAHMITCGWYLLGDSPDGWVALKFPGNETDCLDVADSAGMSCMPGRTKPLQYLHTFWFALSMLMGSEMFADIQPRTTVEIVFTLILQLIGAIVFGMVIGTVGTLLMSSKLLEEKVDRQLAELREFMQEKKIPKPLRKRIRDFMEQLYKAKTGYDVKDVLDHLPPKLSGELLDSMYRDTIVRVPLFQHLEEGAVRDICLAMKPMSVMHGEYIYKENQLGREMYVIEEGQVQLSRYGLVIGVMQKSSFFGEAALQPGRRARDRSAYALVDSTLALLSKMDCERIARDYPNLISAFEHVAARKTKLEAIRMNQLLQDAAEDLGVDVQSSVMQHVLDTVGEMTAQQTIEQVEEKAAVMLQSHFRGFQARKKALTRQAIKKGALNSSPSALSLELDDAMSLVKKDSSSKLRVKLSSLKAQVGPMSRSTGSMISSSDSMTRSTGFLEMRGVRGGGGGGGGNGGGSVRKRDRKAPRKAPKRLDRAKSWRGVYLEPAEGQATEPDVKVNAEAINEIAAKMAHEIMNVREGPQGATMGNGWDPPKDKMLAKLDLDGDGKVDVIGYDTTGDGVIDALDTNMDGKVDTDYIEEAIELAHVAKDHSPGGGAAEARRLGAIEKTLEQVLQGQEALAKKHDELQAQQARMFQNMMQEIAALLLQKSPQSTPPA